MQRRHILLLILLTAAVAAGGCTTSEDNGNTQTISPTPTPAVTQAQAVGAGLPAPTPAAPSRTNKTPQSIGFVDPQTYHLPTPTPTMTIAKPPNDLKVSEKTVEYATVNAEYPPHVLATEVYHIPYPYWRLNVSVTPMNDHPWFAMEIRDPDDPNRVVKEIRYSRADIPYAGSESEGQEETFIIREGYDDFYFVIRSESLKSFSLTIEVPEKYLV